jgi:hypothetical protein
MPAGGPLAGRARLRPVATGAMVLENPGQPVSDIGNRRTTRVEDAPQLRTSSAYGSHLGFRPDSSMHLSVTDGLARCWCR